MEDYELEYSTLTARLVLVRILLLFAEAGGLNAIRLLLPDWSGCAEKFDSTAGEFLLKAEALNLQVVLELPAVPGFLASLDSL